ncbi:MULTISPECIES: DUF3306 domain-containing protein [unclassified Variovorax]|nr:MULTISPECIES: DUF3306 domain-containing protein [unclassified Variovorax]KWT83847.1 hypothetical protein APY03_4402 [Variovorax sp. WDL1]PNG46526.1 hypothetical protein CHC06_06868 [Variovorax sp. B2]PNG47652.1 hypothetical protein CHC07_06819 [Variovorax sp. B4]VTV14287.1 hypothetical protein WDL1CHR_04841 [Variovorax sp. WDL1]
MSEGFFERWSRRKQQVREGEVPEEAVVPSEPAPVAQAARPQPTPVPEAETETPVAPTLADIEGLTPESDFKPFLAGNVAPEVKNAALKKLFADPHFNVMDGLDTYIDDYSVSTPVPESVLRQMASAKFMKLFEEQPDKNPEGDAMPDVAQSTPTDPVPSQPVAADVQPTRQEADDHHADLRLQQDDAARAEDPRRGAG